MSEIQKTSETFDTIFNPEVLGINMAVTHILLVQSFSDKKLTKTYEFLVNQLYKNIEQLKTLNEENRNIVLSSYAQRIQEALNGDNGKVLKIPSFKTSVEKAA